MKIYDELKARGLIAQVTDEELISNLITQQTGDSPLSFQMDPNL